MPRSTNPPPTVDQETQAGRLVAAVRARAGISQRELARRSGVPGPVVNAIERSRRQPSVPTLAKLLRGLDLQLHLEVNSVGTPARHADEGSGGQRQLISHTAVSIRSVSEAERSRAHEIYSALALANNIKRAKRRGEGRGVR